MDLVEHLDHLLDLRLELFTRLDGLGARQSALIEVEDYEGLLAVVAEREEIITAIVAMDGEPVLEGWPDVMASASASRRASIEAKVDRLSMLEGSVATRDESDLRALDARRAEMSKQMRGVDTGRSALGAYAKGAPAAPPMSAKFQDHTV